MIDGVWSLPAALGIGERPELVAFVGGGGKTRLMFTLAAELPGRVVMTTTTRLFARQMEHAPAVVYESDLAALDEALATHRVCFVAGRIEGDKAIGVDPALPACLLARPDVDFVLVEADGSRMLPIKAPADHEPSIPPGTTLLVPMVGLDALEGPIDAVAHRPEQIRAITNYELRMTSEERSSVVDGRLTAAGLARVLVHPQGGLKDAPDGARIVPFLNKAETVGRLAAGREAAELMMAESRVSRVVVGALRQTSPVREVWRRVAAVVLAAGTSSRMGRNKLLLPWRESTVLARTLANVKESSVASVLAVTGHEQEKTEAIAADLYIPTIRNEYYANGMLTSVQTAVRHLPPTVEAALVVLGDQPMVDAEMINALLRAYAAGTHGLIAPTYHGQRGNPVLIDRRYFDELMSLPPEAAPRVLLQRHESDLHYVEFEDNAILHDIDQPEDYERWRPK
ncbi:MAG: putative selenium-dependent hydroxylase accessory protein YqeC [Candidatus Promineofilum sp.]|nr:putative selenium-dependent hydroxylase accessory protein YqeC [Promineifilum sp.]MBP9656292.1 putative selenium-dependent hydroxylase accessory protein YqeC [Promineifilum sp.]